MHQVRNRFIAVLLVGLLVVLILPTSAASSHPPEKKNCEEYREGGVVAPWPSTSSPPFPLNTFVVFFGGEEGTGFMVHRIRTVVPGENFYLGPSGGATHAGNPFPDFNVRFFKENPGQNDSPLSPIFSDQGPERGIVPSNADYGMVWMRTGPDSPLSPDGRLEGAEYEFYNDCSSWSP